MKLHFEIDCVVSSRAKVAIRWFALPVAVLLGSFAVAHAAIDTKWISTKAPVSASLLKANLDGLQTQIGSGRFVATMGGKPYSVGATGYCGNTSGGYTGALGGYVGAKAACETACGSSSAHMCTAEEVVRTWQLGKAIAFSGYAWYSVGLRGMTDTTGNTLNDCGSWNSSSSVHLGAVWDPMNQGVSVKSCNETHGVLCCD